MNNRFFAVLLFAALTLIPRAALAQGPQSAGTWILTPYVGFGIDPDGEGSLAVAGALGYLLTDAFAIEGELGYLFDLAPDSPDVDASLTTIHGNVTYFFVTDYLLMPYLTAGLGVGNLSVDIDGPPDSVGRTEVGFNFGGGVSYQLNDSVAIRGDVRYFNHIDDIPSIWRFMAGVTVQVN